MSSNLQRNVLFLSPVADFKGGAEQSLMDLMVNPQVNPTLVVPGLGALATQAKATGHHVEVLPLGQIQQIHRPVRLKVLWQAALDVWRAVSQLRKIAQHAQADVVHSNGLKMHCLAALARLLPGFPPVVIHIRDIPHRWHEKLLWQLLALCADRVVIISAACWPMQWKPKRVLTIANAMRFEKIQAWQPPQPLVEGSTEPFILGFVGRLTPWKGLEDLLNWLAQAADLPAWKLVIRGAEGEENPGYLAQLHALVQKLGLQDQCIFTGKVEGNLAQVYQGIQVLIVPSREEPFGRTVMEAMALGIPVVATPVGGIPLMLIHEKTGYFANSASTLTFALKALYQPARYQQITQAAQDHIQQSFSVENLHSQINKIYNTLKLN